MIYLILAILSSALIPNIFKLGKELNAKKSVIITFNYVLASGFSLINLLFNYNDIQNTSISGYTESIILSITIGLVTGFFYYGGFYYYQKAVSSSGASLASAFGKLGILIPMLLSIVIWREFPNLTGSIGIILALLAIFIIAVDLKTIKFSNIHPVLFIFFLIGGLGDFSNKIFEKYCLIEHTNVFLFTLFFTALIISLKPTLKTKNKKAKDYILGLVIGIPNVLTSYFLIYALTELNALIVFPIFSGGTIVVASIISALFFKERLQLKEYVAIMIMIIAVSLINI